MSADLSTRYLGLNLKNPVVASAGPLTCDLDSLKRLEQVGIGGVVLPSLFEEQITHDHQRLNFMPHRPAPGGAGSLAFFPRISDYNLEPSGYVALLESAKQSLSIPVIASLNGGSPGSWAGYARLLADAGADAIELNVYFVVTDPTMNSAEVEQRYIDLVATVRQAVSTPIAIKIGAQFSNLANFVMRLAEAGADGVVLFNRGMEPDLDLETGQAVPQLLLSHPDDFRLPLRWIAILRDHVDVSLAATSGIHTAHDIVKLVLVGADVCMLTSVLLLRGIDYATELIANVQRWFDRDRCPSVEQLKGSLSYGSWSDSGTFERANYLKAIVSYTAAS